MINATFREYSLQQYRTRLDAFGVPSPQAVAAKVTMAIFLNNERNVANPMYVEADYVGLTFNKSIDVDCIVEYGNELLKVTHKHKAGKYYQVWMEKMA